MLARLGVLRSCPVAMERSAPCAFPFARFFIDARIAVSQFLAVMSAASDGKQFRAAAAPLFIFLVALGVPLFLATVFFKYGARLDWRSVAVGAAAMVPAAVILSVLMCLLFPVRLSRDGIQAQSIWGLPSFVRWTDIKEAREFKLFNLRWLRLYSSASSTVTWVALFQSHPGEFKIEIVKLAPPESPVLAHIK